jgi:hypothetical protein
MPPEEIAIFLATLTACGLLILGVLELLWPTAGRRAVSRAWPAPATPVRHRTNRHWTRHAAGHPRGYVLTSAVKRAPAAIANGSVRQAPVMVAARGAASGATDVPAAPALAASGPAAASLDDGAARTPLDALLVETCLRLCQDERFEEARSRAVAALPAAAPASPAHVAALWSVVARARQAEGDEAGAAAALEAAIEAAPAADRPTYERQLGALSRTFAVALLERAEHQVSPDAEDRVRTIRAALAWIERSPAMATDPELLETAQRARSGLGPAYEQVATASAQRQDFATARRLLEEALADPSLAAARGDALRELLATTLGSEIGQLTALAIRSMDDGREAEAVDLLGRAQALLGRIAEASLEPRRREELDRRLWWAYSTLGARRLEAADFEAALEPLGHALRLPSIGEERRQETRERLAQALEVLADARAREIRELADAGDHEAAVVESEHLWELLGSAAAIGVSRERLAPAFEKAGQLLGQRGGNRA